MAKCKVTAPVIHHKGLDIEFVRGCASRRVTIVANGRTSPKLLFQDARVFEYVRDETYSLVAMKPGLPSREVEVTRHNPGCLLAAVLKCVEAVVCHHGSFRMIEDAKNPAMAAWFSFKSVARIHVAKISKNCSSHKESSRADIPEKTEEPDPHTQRIRLPPFNILPKSSWLTSMRTSRLHEP